ncbi:IS30 family transposase [Microlunatus panaciterrae]|uniref:IS30 family transposase n=1 Tax=Microlunatus panaciterrae TaxID=400768 RepID=A0ABS2RKR1_9ACTN|nr:IS30 family transposase [Microlunatus panaciterrae]
MIPSVVGEPSGLRLSFAEREEIACRRAAGGGVRQIAREIGRDPATVSRELRRGAGWSRSGYRASVAQGQADRRAARPKVAKLAAGARLRDEVQSRLMAKHSPAQIAARLREDFPDDAEMRVSHETIYQSLYVQGRGALRRELTGCLRTGRALRRPRRDPLVRRGRIANMVNISERPAEVADRAVPGHWEGDLIIGENSASAIGTLVERMTGFVLLLHLPGRHGAVEVEQQMIATIGQLPKLLAKTVTWDQGIEMANHANITLATDIAIYFCDPASPWQRGSNENTNGLLRQYFPKGTDLSGYHPDYLDYVANQLNDRPRKRLDWKTPKEALNELLSQPIDPHGVALTS